MSNVQKATKKWVKSIIDEFGELPSSALNQVYMKGYFAGHSVRSVLHMAQALKDANDKNPIPEDK